MNVTCPECRSVFRVDPSRVPARGVRARCSVCGGIMPVEPMVAGATEPWPRSSVGAPLTPPGPGAHVAPAAANRPTPAFGAAIGSASPTPPSPMPPSPAAPVIMPAAPTPVAPTPVETGPVSPTRSSPTPSHQTPSHETPSWATPSESTPAEPTPSEPPAAWTPSSAPATPAPSVSVGPRSSGAAGARGPINPFLANDPNLKAKRLARALVSDIVAYHPQLREQGLREGTLRQLFKDEIKKSYEEYLEQVGKEFADGTTHFQEALNEILAGGRQLF